MNPYQKFGIFLARVVGTVVVLMGGVSLFYAAVLKGFGRLPHLTVEQWVSNSIWTVGGIVLLLGGNLLGRFLGRDLE
jgi:hypothetical protein